VLVAAALSVGVWFLCQTIQKDVEGVFNLKTPSNTFATISRSIEKNGQNEEDIPMMGFIAVPF